MESEVSRLDRIEMILNRVDVVLDKINQQSATLSHRIDKMSAQIDNYKNVASCILSKPLSSD